MRVFRPRYRRKGKLKKLAKWYVEVIDHNGISRRIPAYTDQRASKELGRKLEELRDCNLARQPISGDLAIWLETIDPSLHKRLAKFGLLNERQVTAGKQLKEHLTDYRRHLEAKENTSRYVTETCNMVEKIMTDCRFRFFNEITSDRVQHYLAGKRSNKNFGARTHNAYLIAIKGFCKWMVKEGRVTESPVQYLSRLNTKTDIRHKRRKLSPEEVKKLLKETAKRKKAYGMTGAERALLYRLAVETGLRWGELRSLTRASFYLEGEYPHILLKAADSKHRCEDTLPLRVVMVPILKMHLAILKAEDNAFSMWQDHGSDMLHADLKAAGINRETPEGIVDFHALRHTCASWLAANGVQPQLVQRIMRHSDINLTMRFYTHLSLENLSEALGKLPDLDTLETEAKITETAS